MASSIICGVDDSPSAKGAARVARTLASELGLRLTFVRVVERDTPDAKMSAIAERLERLSAGANDLDCGAAWLVEVGHPADRLVEIAKADEAALIVVGSSGPRSSLLGSISADVSRRAPCPVVVVPPGAATGLEERPQRHERSDRRNGPGAIPGFSVRGSGADSRGRVARMGLGARQRGASDGLRPADA
jgi:nucleotide-binding universal stress UspA family protein